MSDSGSSTRERILAAGELLFAEHGYAAASLREVTELAGVNLAAVHYHFGSKEGLFTEMLRARIEPINRRRVEMLEGALAESGGGPLSLEALFRIILRPLADALEGEGGLDRTFLRLISRSMTEPSEFIQEAHRRFFTEMRTRFAGEMQRAWPVGDAEEMAWMVYLASAAMVGAIVQYPKLKPMFPQIREPENIHAMVERLVDFLVAGVRGLTPAEERRGG